MIGDNHFFLHEGYLDLLELSDNLKKEILDSIKYYKSYFYTFSSR